MQRMLYINSQNAFAITLRSNVSMKSKSLTQAAASAIESQDDDEVNALDMSTMQKEARGFLPDKFTFPSVIKACSGSQSVRQGKEIHNRIIKAGLEVDLYVGSALVDMYSKCGIMDYARQVFDKMPQRDVVLWTALVAAYAQNGSCKEAMMLFCQMGNENLKPNTITWNAIISGYAQHGPYGEALNQLRQMQLACMSPDVVTVVSVLPACAHLAALQKGREIHGYIIRRGFEADVFVMSALIDMYAKCGIIDCARHFFDRMEIRDVVSWNAMIVAYGMHGHCEDALFLFNEIPHAVIKRFEQREHAADSRAVAEYLKALVATNLISEYLPDEQSAEPAGLPALLLELKQRASGNIDEPFFNPGMSEKHPLHVVMVDPKAASKSTRMVQELVQTIFFMILFSLIWVMGASALRKYVSSLGSGVGSSPGISTSATYSPKEYSKEVVPEKNSKTFKDVKGCDDAKQELEEVVEYLKNPTKFTRLGGKLPKGILLTGAPGTGKTLLAKAIAGEAGVPFFYRAGSEFEEMFVGVGARRVRTLFQAAKKKAPCIVFIDEIDAVGSTRKQWEGHTKKTLHQLLVEMDGFEQNEGIILVAATNLPEILDPALTRPGRFDRHIVVPSPDVRGRQEILELYLQNKPLADDVEVKAIARGTAGFNGADLANLVNIAAIKAAVDGSENVSAKHLEFAKDRIIMGTERKSMLISEESRKLTAYHESGHAVVALNTAGARPVHKATITPRGDALGMVTQLPAMDETSVSKAQLLARLDVCMGGRVAEEMVFGPDHVTTGAKSDLHTATELAQYMVSSCGMSDLVGPIYVKENASGDMQSKIDAEVMRLLKEAYMRVKTLLKKHEAALHALANALLDKETLNAQEIKNILDPFQNIEEQFEPVEQVELAVS